MKSQSNRCVILNADDYGYDSDVSRGILEAITGGLVSSTTFVVNSPTSREASEKAPARGVGLHFNVVRFQAIHDPSFAFFDDLAPTLTHDFVIREAHAQIALFKTFLHRAPTHIDVHKHAHRFPNILAAVIEVAHAHQLPVRSIDAVMRAELKSKGVVTNDVFIGEADRTPFWTFDELSHQISTLEGDGIVEWMCHPGYWPRAIQSAYGLQREVELATLTSDNARQLAKKAGIRFISWDDVIAA